MMSAHKFIYNYGLLVLPSLKALAYLQANQFPQKNTHRKILQKPPALSDRAESHGFLTGKQWAIRLLLAIEIEQLPLFL